MYAEITIHFRDEFNRNRFFGGMPTSAGHQDVLAKTVFSRSLELASTAVYSRILPSTAYIVFEEGSQGFRVHVENTINKGSISKLKGAAEDVLRTFLDAGRHCGCRSDVAVIRIHAEDNLTQTGSKIRFWHRLGERFRETIIGDFVVTSLTAVVAYFVARDLATSMVSGLSALLALVLWLIIEVLLYKDEYRYEDA